MNDATVERKFIWDVKAELKKAYELTFTSKAEFERGEE
jgi:hypothetical protein